MCRGQGSEGDAVMATNQTDKINIFPYHRITVDPCTDWTCDGLALKQDDQRPRLLLLRPEAGEVKPLLLQPGTSRTCFSLNVFGSVAAMWCFLGLLVLFTVWTEACPTAEPFAQDSTQFVRRGSEAQQDEDELPVAELLEKANRHLNRLHVYGDVAVSPLAKREADSCVLSGCLWPRDPDGKVYVPYVIANHYFSHELDVIRRAMDSFSSSTCVRFVPRSDQKDYLHIQSLPGCYSYVGRRGNGQLVSLSRRGCLHHGTVQHELLHALGFNHEHCRSDRDQHIKVLLANVMSGREFNFDKVDTRNQQTPYDYSSVMHYGRLAFSKDSSSPTMEAVPSAGAVFGRATRMSRDDAERIKLLYCSD